MLDDALIADAMKYSAARSKRAVVHEALVTYVAVKAEQQRVAGYRDRLAGVRRRLADAAPKTPVLKILRADRERSR